MGTCETKEVRRGRMVGRTVILALACCLANLVKADEKLIEEEGEGRLGFYTVGSDGSTTLAFNATSIQNAVILGLFTLVLGALVLPLFGLSLGSLFGAESTGSGYGYQYGNSEPAYGSGGDPYAEFVRRNGVESVAPVIEALMKGKKKYDEDN